MKIHIEAQALCSGVSWVAKNLSAKPPRPEMANLVLQTLGDTAFIGIASTDGESVSKVCIPADVLDPGAVSVPGTLLAEIASKLECAQVEIAVEGSRGVLSCGRARYSFSTGNLGAHPLAPNPSAAFGALPVEHGKVGAKELAAGVSQVVRAAGRDRALPALSSIQVTASNTGLTLAATDRSRVAVCELPWTPTTEWSAAAPWSASSELPPPVLIPAVKLVEMARGLQQERSEQIALSLPMPGGASVTLAGKGRVVSTRVHAGEFPAWEALFTQAESEHTATVSFQAKELLTALHQAQVGKKSDAVHLTFTEHTCRIEAEGSDALGVSSAECSYDGAERTIAFNAEFLATGIEAAGTPTVTIALSEANKAVVVRGSTPGFRYMLMPLNIRRRNI